MCLQAVLGISSLRYAVGEGHVDVVELVPHFIGCGVQQDFYLIPELVGGGSLALGEQDVVVGELGPGIWQGESDRRNREKNDLHFWKFRLLLSLKHAVYEKDSGEIVTGQSVLQFSPELNTLLGGVNI